MDEQDAIREAAAILGLEDVVQFARGGQKVVCRARSSGRPVILKVVMVSASTDPNALERCEREVSLLKEMTSPRIVRVLSDLVKLGSGPDAAAWVEEELDGEDLSALLGSQWASIDAQVMMRQVSEGLTEFHARGFVHRDLSAGNVRRTATAGWKVMDPGLAKHLNRSSITGLWQPGTPGYLSPEHAAPGSRVTSASDVFCVGILGFIALTGQYPVDPSGAPLDYRRRLLNARPPSIQSFRPDVRADFAAVIDRCLDGQAARRYLDAQELFDALDALGPGSP